MRMTYPEGSPLREITGPVIGQNLILLTDRYAHLMPPGLRLESHNYGLETSISIFANEIQACRMQFRDLGCLLETRQGFFVVSSPLFESLEVEISPEGEDGGRVLCFATCRMGKRFDASGVTGQASFDPAIPGDTHLASTLSNAIDDHEGIERDVISGVTLVDGLWFDEGSKNPRLFALLARLDQQIEDLSHAPMMSAIEIFENRRSRQEKPIDPQDRIEAEIDAILDAMPQP